MKTLENYLDDLKERTGSDYQSAIALNIDRSVISKMRKRGAMADENAVKIANLLKIEPSEILLAAAIARSEGSVKKAWVEISKRAGLAASILIAIMLFFPVAKVTLPKVNNIYYARSHDSTIPESTRINTICSAFH